MGLVLSGAAATERPVPGAPMEDESNADVENENEGHWSHEEDGGREEHEELAGDVGLVKGDPAPGGLLNRLVLWVLHVVYLEIKRK